MNNNQAVNHLLVATLLRAGRPMDSAELLDAATELALDSFWTTDHLAGVSRGSVAARCAAMAKEGLIKQEGVGMDRRSRARATPLFAPVDGYDAQAPIPAPPTSAAERVHEHSVYENFSRTQLIALLDIQDGALSIIADFLRAFEKWQVSSNARAVAGGLRDAAE